MRQGIEHLFDLARVASCPSCPRELTCQRPPGVPRSQTSAELVRREGKPPTAQPNRTLVTDSEISLIQPMPLRRLVTGGARGSMGRSRGRLLGRGRPEPCNGSPVRQRGRHSRIDASLRRRDRDSAGASRVIVSLRRGAAAELRSSATSHVQLCDHRVLDEGRRSSSPCTGVLDRSQCLVAPQPAPLGISPAPSRSSRSPARPHRCFCGYDSRTWSQEARLLSSSADRIASVAQYQRCDLGSRTICDVNRATTGQPATATRPRLRRSAATACETIRAATRAARRGHD